MCADVTLNLLDHGMDLLQAVDAPRARGYTVNRSEIGSVQMVRIDPVTGLEAGAADSRREGTVIALLRPLRP